MCQSLGFSLILGDSSQDPKSVLIPKADTSLRESLVTFPGHPKLAPELHNWQEPYD